MKKIAMIVHGLSGGGAERVAAILASYLVAHQHEVLYLCVYNTAEEDNKARYPLDERVKVKYISAKPDLPVVRFAARSIRIRQELRRFSPDDVVSLITYEAVLAAFARYPFIYSLRNDPERSMQLGMRSRLTRIMLSKATKIVFQSKGARDYFHGEYDGKSVVIPNPINTKALPLWTDFEHQKRFMTASRLAGQKNLSMLVEAFSMVHREHPDYTLEIYGKGSEESALAAQIQTLHAEDYIFLKGFSSDIHAVMAQSSGFVLSSNHEGLSNSMLEALCIGVPCICTDCPPGSNREFITSGENGFLTKVGDAQDMKEKICTLIENPALAAAFAEKNLETRRRLDTEIVCRQWAELFQ